MLTLAGVEEFRRQELDKWDFKVKTGRQVLDGFRTRRYLMEFSCPLCREYRVVEDCQKVRPPGSEAYWSISWRSKCDDMGGRFALPVQPRQVPVLRARAFAIVPLLRPHGAMWQRLNWNPSFGSCKPVRFGGFGQALMATIKECQLFGILQTGDRRYR
jgi:hypothetical protein